MNEYPLYDVPWLVREANGNYMSQKRHEIEVRNQAVVDDYFLARDRGVSAREARRMVGEKHGMKPRQVYHCFVWYFQEAQRRNIIIPDF